MLTQQNLLDIEKLAIAIDHDAAFGGKSKGNKHLLRVVAIVEFMAKKLEANLPIAIAGALLHDTALPTGDDYNYETNKKVVKNILEPLHLDQDDVDQIAECVASHEGTANAKSLEAKIVHDADVIEKLGLLGVIRHTWKLTNFGKIDPEHITDQDVKTILDHIEWRSGKLNTDLSQKIGKYMSLSLDHERAKTIITLVSNMAFKGIITEKIAQELEKVLEEEEIQKLREQLSLGYLEKFEIVEGVYNQG